MQDSEDVPTTPALDVLANSDLRYRVVRTRIASGPEESAELQGIPLAALLRTIVVRRGEDDYLFLLIPGGRRLDWPKLRAHLGVSRISLPDAEEARAVTVSGSRTDASAITGQPRVAPKGVMAPRS